MSDHDMSTSAGLKTLSDLQRGDFEAMKQRAEAAEAQVRELRKLYERLSKAVLAIKIGTGNHWAPPHCLSLKATSGPEAQEFLEALADYQAAIRARGKEGK